MTLSRRSTIISVLSFLVLGITVATWCLSKRKSDSIPESKLDSANPSISSAEESQARIKAWNAVAQRLEVEEKKFADRIPQRIDVALSRLNTFMDSRRAGVVPFAAEALGWKEVWALAKAQISEAASDEHHAKIRERFEEHIFKSQDLQEQLEEIVRSFSTEVMADERQLLNEVRQEILKSGPQASQFLSESLNEETFQIKFFTVVPHTLSRANQKIQHSIDSSLRDMVIRQLATDIANKLAKGLAIRVGIAGLRTASFGIGIVGKLVVSLALDQILSKSKDPAEVIHQRVNEILDEMILFLKEGSDEALVDYSELVQSSNLDPDSKNREKARNGAELIERSGHLGIRHELFHIAKHRAEIRNEALKQLIIGEPK